MDTPFVLLALNALLGVIMLFVGVWLRNLTSDIEKLRDADSSLVKELTTSNEKINERISQCVHGEDFRAYRKEQAEMFDKLFDKIDAIKDSVALKVDRREHPR